MPLSTPAERDPIHTRVITGEGYRRRDGLWDIEGTLTDTKAYAFDNRDRGTIHPGVPVHGMAIRLTIDDSFLIHAIEASTDHGPYAICGDITPAFQKMVGLTIGRGFRAKVFQRLGGVHGCRHLVDLLLHLGTVAFQTIYPLRDMKTDGDSAERKPSLLNSCHALASDGPVTAQRWPHHYTGPRPVSGDTPDGQAA